MKSYYTKPVAVQAAEITGVSGVLGGYVLGLENMPNQKVSDAQCGNHTPRVGDFLIFGENDDTYLCPREVFLKKYHVGSGSMNFGQAVEVLKAGGRVARAGWNGKRMFLFLVPGSTFKVNRAPLLGIYPEGTEINYCPHIDMKTADGRIVPWLASQTDVLAEDWEIL